MDAGESLGGLEKKSAMGKLIHFSFKEFPILSKILGYPFWPLEYKLPTLDYTLIQANQIMDCVIKYIS